MKVDQYANVNVCLVVDLFFLRLKIASSVNTYGWDFASKFYYAVSDYLCLLYVAK